MSQKPSVGRIIHVETAFHGPVAAIITSVEKDGGIMASLFLPKGGAVSVTFTAEQAAGDTPKPGCWNWPPRV